MKTECDVMEKGIPHKWNWKAGNSNTYIRWKALKQRRNKEYYVMIKGLTHQEDITIVNV